MTGGATALQPELLSSVWDLPSDVGCSGRAFPKFQRIAECASGLQGSLRASKVFPLPYKALLWLRSLS
eukprot:13108937-Alexandrium_andersonii.AAC.1